MVSVSDNSWQSIYVFVLINSSPGLRFSPWFIFNPTTSQANNDDIVAPIVSYM